MNRRAGWSEDRESGLPEWLRALALAGAAAFGWLVLVAAVVWVWLVIAADRAHATESTSSQVAVHSPETTVGDDALARRAQYGVALAMAGRYREAESEFTSLLSESPGDARALANLGNLRLLNGEIDVALAFYDRALRFGPQEAGIVLNRATTLMLMGDRDQAEREAARGIALAGGETGAETLLGLNGGAAPVPAGRASSRRLVGKEEIRELLVAASRRIHDSMQASAAAPDSGRAEVKPKRSNRMWRSAATRASDGGDIAFVLYWKKT